MFRFILNLSSMQKILDQEGVDFPQIMMKTNRSEL